MKLNISLLCGWLLKPWFGLGNWLDECDVDVGVFCDLDIIDIFLSMSPTSTFSMEGLEIQDKHPKLEKYLKRELKNLVV